MYTSRYIASATENTFDITGADSSPIFRAGETQGFQTVNFELFGNTTSGPKTIAHTLEDIGDTTALTLYYRLFILEGAPEGIVVEFTKVGATSVPINGE